MSIANENNRVDLVASSGQTIFTYDFKINAADEIAVYLTADGSTPDDATDILILTTDYAVSGVGDDAGGNIILTVAATLDDSISMVRAIDFDQPDEFVVGQDNAEAIESTLDSHAMRIQRLAESVDRAVKSSGVTEGKEYILPFPASGEILSWNTAADAIVNRLPTYDPLALSYTVATKADAVLLNPVTDKTLYILSDDGKGNIWQAVTGAAPGTYSDDGGSFCGTVFIPTGGDGSSAWVRDYDDGVYPEWFGAIGGGVNDTVAMQLAIASSLIVNFEAITYSITTVTLRSNGVYRLYGATIKAHSSQPDGQRIIDGRGELSNILIIGGTVDGDKSSFGVDHRQHGIAIVAENVRVMFTTVKNIGGSAAGSLGDGIILEPTIPDNGYQSTNIKILNCNINTVDRQCLTIESGINVIVDGCYFEDAAFAAIDIEPAGFTIGDCSHITISNCHIKDCDVGISVVSEQTPTLLSYIVNSNNIFDGVSTAYQFRGCTDAKVIGGLATNVATQGIYIFSDATSTVDGVEIKDFTCDSGKYGVRGQIVSTGSLSNITIDGCDLSNSTVEEIDIDNCSDLIITNNKLRYSLDATDLAASGRGTQGGIYLLACASPILKDNVIKPVSTITGTGVGIKFVTTVSNPVVSGNVLDDCDIGIASLTTTATTVFTNAPNTFLNITTSEVTATVDTYWQGTFAGSFTMAAASIANVTDNRSNTASIITISPKILASAVVMAGSKRLWHNGAGTTNNVQWRVQTADGTNAAGTETFDYIIINR